LALPPVSFGEGLTVADLARGYAIPTKGFKQAVVREKLGEGGQGAVYQVDYDGASKALKWYSGKRIQDVKKFYANLENNIKKGAPTPAFLWPQDITDRVGDGFGYIMALRPPEYKDFSRFLLGKEGFANVTAMTHAALNIVAAFRALHSRGYSYQDLNDGNFFINPKNGAVLICDNDNVSEYGKNSGIAGKARYMAPEIVAKGAEPCIKTDRFSLSVVLFMLWTSSHPLEGKSACPPCMDARSEKRIYGEAPVYIFDPNDLSNRPIAGLHRGAFGRYPFLPKYLQEIFAKSFSKDALHNGDHRIIEQEWLRVFIRMRGEVYKCACAEVYFADPVDPNHCPKCGQKAHIFGYLKTARYALPIHQKTRLYACHTQKDSDDFQTLTAQILETGGGFRLKNLSNRQWSAEENGIKTGIAPNADLVLKKGMTIDFGGYVAAME
jgi:serine/threonine protein kinase